MAGDVSPVAMFLMTSLTYVLKFIINFGHFFFEDDIQIWQNKAWVAPDAPYWLSDWKQCMCSRLQCIALCGYPIAKMEIKDSSQISTTAPIFLYYNYFRQNIWVNILVHFHFQYIFVDSTTNNIRFNSRPCSRCWCYPSLSPIKEKFHKCPTHLVIPVALYPHSARQGLLPNHHNNLRTIRLQKVWGTSWMPNKKPQFKYVTARSVLGRILANICIF